MGIINKKVLSFILLSLLFILCFLSIWGNDNIKSKYNKIVGNERFSEMCPKKYMDKNLSIVKQKNILNGNVNDTSYNLNTINARENKYKTGSQEYEEGMAPQASNYNFNNYYFNKYNKDTLSDFEDKLNKKNDDNST